MRIILTCLALLSLAACGFEPVHGKASTQRIVAQGGVDLSAIIVSVDRTRLGQLLKAEISDRIHPRLSNAPKRYRLSITLEESELSRFINPDGTPSRGDFVYNSSYSLIDLVSKKQVATGTLERISSYNISDSADYATFVTQEDARKRGVIALAQGYALRLSNIEPKPTP